MNFIQLIKNNGLDGNKLYFIPIEDSIKRKQVHYYLEKYIPNVPKTSLKCKKFNGISKRFYPCHGCDKKLEIKPEDYRHGDSQGNKDESYSLWCNTCDEITWYEPNYNYMDQTFILCRNNGIGIGSCFYSYINRNQDQYNIDDKECETILNNSTIYVMDLPELNQYKSISKKDAEKYIKTKIDNIEYTLQD